jgi:Rha family phage regulatory protein
MTESIVEFRDGVPVVSSVQLASLLGKRHGDLVRSINERVHSINKLGESDSADEDHFMLGSYLDAIGRSRPMFWITVSGLAIIGFHRKKAQRVAQQVLMAIFEARDAATKRSQALWDSLVAMNGTDEGKANWTKEAIARACDGMEWCTRVVSEQHSRIIQMAEVLDQHVPDWRERVTFNKLPPPK